MRGFSDIVVIAVALAFILVGIDGCKKQAEPEFPAGLTWLDENISTWAKTATLQAYVAPPVVRMDSNKGTVWPNREGKGTDGTVNRNAWIIFESVAGDGKWYASTWEWLRKQNPADKTLTNPLGSYIKHFSVVPWKWNPAHGQRIGIMVSGLARVPGDRTVPERSNISWIVWP